MYVCETGILFDLKLLIGFARNSSTLDKDIYVRPEIRQFVPALFSIRITTNLGMMRTKYFMFQTEIEKKRKWESRAHISLQIEILSKYSKKNNKKLLLSVLNLITLDSLLFIFGFRMMFMIYSMFFPIIREMIIEKHWKQTTFWKWKVRLRTWLRYLKETSTASTSYIVFKNYFTKCLLIKSNSEYRHGREWSTAYIIGAYFKFGSH